MRSADTQNKSHVVDDRLVPPPPTNNYATNDEMARRSYEDHRQLQGDAQYRAVGEIKQRYEGAANLQRAKAEVDRQKRYLKQLERDEQYARAQQEASSNLIGFKRRIVNRGAVHCANRVPAPRLHDKAVVRNWGCRIDASVNCFIRPRIAARLSAGNLPRIQIFSRQTARYRSSVLLALWHLRQRRTHRASWHHVLWGPGQHPARLTAMEHKQDSPRDFVREMIVAPILRWNRSA